MAIRRRSASRIHQLLRSDFRRLKDAAAGPSLGELSRLCGLPPESIIKLDAGENHYGASPRVRTRLAHQADYHLYPAMEYGDLRRAIGEYVGLDPECVFVGCGADEILDVSLRLTLNPGEKVINCPPTFAIYDSLIRLNRGISLEIPRKRRDYRLDIHRILSALDRRTKAIIVCTPNNPTGNLAGDRELLRLLETRRLILVDEAYFEFCGHTVAPWVRSYDNLIVVRSFSKWAGVAGLRIGYGLAGPGLAEKIAKIKMPYTLCVAAQEAALASLEDLSYLRRNVARIQKERERLAAQFSRIPDVKAYPAFGNFIYVQVRNGKAARIHAALKRRGIFLRYYDGPLTGQAFRITVGTPAQNRALLATWDDVNLRM